MNHSTVLINRSMGKGVWVKMCQSECASDDEKNTGAYLVPPNSKPFTLPKKIDSGCALLSIYDSDPKSLSSPPTWQGIVPVGTSKPIYINPGEGNRGYSVYYDTVQNLPSCPAIENYESLTPSGDDIAKIKPAEKGWYRTHFTLILVLMLILLFFLIVALAKVCM